MRKIFMLAFANIKKTKGNTLSLLIMLLMTALLLNAGLLVMLNFGGFFEKTIDELKSTNVYYIMPTHLYTDEVKDYIANDDNIMDSEEQSSMWTTAVVKTQNGLQEQSFLINDADQPRQLSKWKFIGKYLPADEMSIYLPYIYQVSTGYKLDDSFEMEFKDTKMTFTIKGFTEDIFFSSPETGLMGIYLPHETYELVKSKLDDTVHATLIYANLNKVNKTAESELKAITKAESISATMDFNNALFSLDLELVKLSRIMMANIMSVMIVAFSLIVAIVCLIVIRFRIGNTIEDDMEKIGSLKAIGYTSRQIVLSIVLQFLMIAFIGSTIGILLSYLSTPLFSDVFAQQSGFKWVQGFDGVTSGISLGLILGIVILITLITARGINKLHPIVALRGGITTHSFRKNRLPLSETKGWLSVVLAFKSMLQNMKQTIMIMIIITAVAIAGSFSVVMYYNTTVDTKTFKETPGIELSNVIAAIKPEVDKTVIAENVLAMDDVRKVQYIDEVKVQVDINEVITYVMDDYSKRETDTTYKGRYPRHSNEIAIAGYLAGIIDKKIGDSITLKMGDLEADYIITGLTQGATMGGMNASITTDGIRKINPDFVQSVMQIYLNKDVNAADFIITLKSVHEDSFKNVIDLDAGMELGTQVYTSIVSKLGIAILIVSIAVVVLVLYFVIGSSIIRKKHELGIQKAIGYTTFQLMNQVSLSLLIPVIIGVCIGSTIGMTQTNRIMTIAQSSMAIMKANYIITPVWIGLFGVSIVIISYITSMLLTFRIRKVSAYSLVCE